MKSKKIGLYIVLLGLFVFLCPQIKAVGRDIMMFSDIKNYGSSKLNDFEHIKNIEKIIKSDKIINGNIIDVFSNNIKDKNETNLEVEHIGYVYIPKIGLTYKLYNKANLKKLEKGVAVLEGSSIPNDNEENRTIIAGHNMWQGTAIFRDIKDLKQGDKVYIHSLRSNYEYEVTDFKVIDQYDNESISVIKNTNILTLLTCVNDSKFDKRYIVNLKLTNVKTTTMNSQNLEEDEKLFQGFEIDPPKSLVDYIFDKNISSWQKMIRFQPYFFSIVTVVIIFFVFIKILRVKKLVQ